jgi:hypothetical protein
VAAPPAAGSCAPLEALPSQQPGIRLADYAPVFDAAKLWRSKCKLAEDHNFYFYDKLVTISKLTSDKYLW